MANSEGVFNSTTFEKELQELGIRLNLEESDGPLILRQEQALVVRDLEEYFDKNGDRVESFVDGLKVMCRNEKYFRRALMLTNMKKSTNDSMAGRCEQIEQESLFRIFLKVNCLQKEVTNFLLNEMTNTSSECEEDTSWLHLLLSPLRYLSFIKDPHELITKITDMLEVASYPAQLEILDSIPEIVHDNQYCEVAKHLCKLLDENDELTGAIIDCLNALNLDSDVRLEVHDRILSKMASGSTLKIFPILLSFLLTDCKSQNCVETLMKIRNTLDTIMLSSDRSNEKDSCKILIFNKLQSFSISRKIVSESWLNMISNIKSHSDHKAIDYLVLFMLHFTMVSKRRIIEAIFRKRVNSGLFRIGQMEKMFHKYLPQQLLKDYFQSIVEIGCSLLRSSSDQITTEFANTQFTTLFHHDHTEAVNRREMLDSLLMLIGSAGKKTASNVLKIISSFLADVSKLRQHTAFLMRLLEKLDALDLKDVKVVFEILCSLTCGPDVDQSLSGFKDEIHMIIRKQLYSSKKMVKHRGIVSAVVMARNIVQIPTDTSFLETSALPKEPIRSASNLQRGPAREAGTLLEMVVMCCAGCPELIGLYYDQLAAMLVANHHVDKLFMTWLYETVTADFREKFVIRELPSIRNDLNITSQYLINSLTEMDTPEMGVNIAGLTLTKDPSVFLLAPHFRLVRLLHYRLQDGDLSSLDALLGCMVAMPEVEDVADLDSDQASEVADCLFHCANWFREVISGFVTKGKRNLRSKVLKRLEDLLDVERKLQRCLERVPEHKLPTSYFHLDVDSNKHNVSPPTKNNESKPKNLRKKMKTAETVNKDLDDTVTVSGKASQGKRKKPASKVTGAAEHTVKFRDLDTDIVLLLKYPLKWGENHGSQLSSQSATLSIEQLNFLLKDLVSKLSVCTQNEDVGLSHLNEVVPLHLIKDASSHILPHLDMHLKSSMERIDKLLIEADGELDAPELCTAEALGDRECFGLILEAFYLIFGWTGFQNSANLEVLKALLISATKSSADHPQPTSAAKLIAAFATRLSALAVRCLDLRPAVHLVRTLAALAAIADAGGATRERLVATAAALLAKPWPGAADRRDVAVLVDAYLAGAGVETVAGLIGTLREQAGGALGGRLPMLASIDQRNFHVFYGGLCAALLSRVKSEVRALTNSQHLQLWSTTCLSLQGLMVVAKAQESKNNLTCFLKKSIGILKVFLTHGIPILEITLRSKPDEVVNIFKSMQHTTRFLHHLCCYTKFTKDAKLMAYVPQFRLTLETLVYRVKAALVANKCSTAFWMGNLRNRDLHGEDILSQSTVLTEEGRANAEGSSEDEALPTDESDAEDVGNGEEDRSTSSEVFD